MTPVLETGRLMLRPVTLADAPAIQRHFGRWEIIRYLSVQVPWPYPDDGAFTWLRDVVLPAVESGASVAWALTLKGGNDEAIGLLEWRCSAAEDADNRGFWLAEDHWGQGLMTEAVTAFQDHVFFDLGLERIFVLNAVSNRASRRIKEKTGARLVGTVQAKHHSGETETERWMVTREAWATFRAT